MKFTKYLAAAAALSLASAPAVAETAPARASAPSEVDSELGGNNQATILVILGLLAIALAFVTSDDGPTSP